MGRLSIFSRLTPFAAKGSRHASKAPGLCARRMARDGRAVRIAAVHYFADASGSIFRGDAFQPRMGFKKAFALREGHGMRSHCLKFLEFSTRKADQIVFDRQDGLAAHFEGAFEQEIVYANDGAREGVFHGNE